MMGTGVGVRVGMAALSALVAVALAAGSSAVAAPAAARFHVALTKAEPGMNDTVTVSPKVIRLWFSEPVQAAVTGARVTGPKAHVVPLGVPHVDSGPKAPIVATISEKLGPGKYTVAWKTMAEDGHPASGTFSFVVRFPIKKE